MFRFWTAALVALSAVTVLASAEAHSVKGRGAVAVEDHHGAGAGLTMMFSIDARSDAPNRGFLVFAGEDHDHYPGLHIRMQSFERVEIEGNKAEVAGLGTLNGMTMRVNVEVVDGQRDHVHVRCYKLTGEKAYERHGDMIRGDIALKVGE